jgi:phosphate transport system substrate-binding protein
LTPETKALMLPDSKGKFYQGTFDEVLQQKYPLSRVIHIYLNQKPGEPLKPVVKEFLKFILSEEGQNLVVREGVFLPMTAKQVKAELAKLK